MDRNLTGLKLPPGAVSPPPELTEDEMFSTDINKTVLKRFIQFVTPYKLMIFASSILPVPKVSTETETGSATPIA